MKRKSQIAAGALMVGLTLALQDVAAHELTLSDGRTVDYSGLRSANGMWDCCGNGDCEEVEWREVAGGRLEALLPEFGWVQVPPSVMRPPHPDAPDRMHACWSRNIDVLNLRCVMPPGFGT